ncbi:MAG: monofunctional biosynthetic peptidoglycan transglycosylase [Bacteroidetes bacterium]|nr:monofunctional biosynthetic peptidoglycan transglycosylase [Bacteroidota bacterium]MCW5896127.1 monofunctional biosynthetic peptidoglycan transglycosylase [Bacteroidota bacterium]
MTTADDAALKQNTLYLVRLWHWAKANKAKTVFLLFGFFVLYEALTIPWFSVASLKENNPTETALMRQRIGEAEHDGRSLKIVQSWVPLSRIPRHVINAVIVAEDGTFWEHDGFDWYEFQQSLRKNWEKKKVVRGASTITQQLAKNLYLSTSKDPLRKLKEWIITLLLEQHLDKSRILEVYLNVIEWGRGIFGIEAAARTYFGCSASSLSVEQSLRLAAVIPSPLKHKPTDNTRWVTFRKNIVAARLQGRRYYEPEAEPEDEEENGSIESLPKETEPSEHQIEPQPADTGDVSLDKQDYREVMPNDTTDNERGGSNDVQGREPTD